MLPKAVSELPSPEGDDGIAAQPGPEAKDKGGSTVVPTGSSRHRNQSTAHKQTTNEVKAHCAIKKKVDKEAEGQLKARITDVDATVNPKGKTMYKIEDYGQYYGMTNKENPVPIDIQSGDGRMVSFRSGEEYRNRSQQWWGCMVEHFERPDVHDGIRDVKSCKRREREP